MVIMMIKPHSVRKGKLFTVVFSTVQILNDDNLSVFIRHNLLFFRACMNVKELFIIGNLYSKKSNVGTSPRSLYPTSH